MTIDQQEALRIAVLNFLAPRHVAAFNAEQIADRLKAERKLDFAVTAAQVNDACGVLVKLGLAEQVVEMAFGVVPHYQASGNGIIQSEKWRLARGMA